MRIAALFLLLFCISASVFGQTDSAVVKVDSAMRRPGTPSKKTGPVTQSPPKPTVFKDSARLALESLVGSPGTELEFAL